MPGGVQTIAFDANDPTSGLFLRTRQGWLAAARAAASAPTPVARAGAAGLARRASTTCSGPTPRCRPTPRRSWSTRGSTSRATPRPPARSTTSAGISAPPASGCCTCRTAAAIPDRLPFGLPLAGRRVPSSAGPTASGPRPTEPRLPRRRSPSSRRDLQEFRSLQGLAGLGASVHPGAEAGGAGLGALGRDRPRGRADRHGGRPCRSAGRDARSARWRGLRGGLAPGTDHGGDARAAWRGWTTRSGSSGSRRVSSIRCSRCCPTGDSVWVGTRRGLLLALAGTGRRGASRRARVALTAGSGRGARLAGRHRRGAHPRPAALAQSRHGRPGPSAPT